MSAEAARTLSGAFGNSPTENPSACSSYENGLSESLAYKGPEATAAGESCSAEGCQWAKGGVVEFLGERPLSR